MADAPPRPAGGKRRHAEIAGGGIGGLALGMMLGRQGWSVRIHERSPAVREIGAGISLRNNCLAVLEHYEVFPRLEPLGSKLRVEFSVNRHGRVMQRRALSGHHRTHVFPRQCVVDVLAQAAREAGAEIVTSSHITAAEPSGALVDADGRRYHADLVVGADGIRSRVRQSLGLGARLSERGTRVNRYLVPTRSFTTDGVMFEHWSGGRRVGIMPSGPGQTFVYLVMPRRDARACALPLDTASWQASYPGLADAFALIAATEGSQYPYQLVDCPKWSSGRVALIGDAAHGMPPTLGQGAGLTMMNAHALAEIVSGALPVEEALAHWEQTVRFISDQTRRWAVRYDQFTRYWPLALRPAVMWAFGHFPALNERMRIADQGLALTSVKLTKKEPLDAVAA